MTKFVGIEKIDYISKKTGNPVKGVKLHVLYDGHKDTTGYRTESLYMSDRDYEELGIDCSKLINHDIDIRYNRWGKICSIEVLN